jgi:hypothetical protein
LKNLSNSLVGRFPVLHRHLHRHLPQPLWLRQHQWLHLQRWPLRLHRLLPQGSPGLLLPLWLLLRLWLHLRRQPRLLLRLPLT